MDKNSIKKYAMWARRELISRVSQKALQYGVSENEIVDANADTINGHLLTANEKKQRQALISRINQIGYEQTMEEAAYTWFNRFSALRFMEVNGYLPTHVRVFTDEQNAFKPQILAEAIHLELDGLNMEKVYELKDQNKTDELYKYLLITQCNALSTILPGMFTRIADYTELLFPENLLREGSVIEQMISMIPEDDWKDAVQIIGWLYQYYNAEPKEIIFSRPSTKKINKNEIPAATQVFTPDWIVRYMVENSLGRLWLEGHPSDELKAKWKYYLDEANQEPNVQAQLIEIRKEYAALKPEEIKVIDPCMGSGHILVYMFDVLVQIYESYGYNAREAAGLILKNNLYGLDIDDRAAQLAYFAVMMKARQYDRRIFSRGIQPHVYAIVESNGISGDILTYFENGDDSLKKAMDTLVRELHDAKEYGSILNVTQVDFAALYARLKEIKDDISIFATAAQSELRPLIEVAETMALRYHAVITNPPYAGRRTLNSVLCNYLDNYYPDSKMDLFSAFIERNISFARKNAFLGFMTPFVWLFLSSYTNLRNALLSKCAIDSFVQPEEASFQEAAVTICSFVLRNCQLNYCGSYIRQSNFHNPDEQEMKLIEAAHNRNVDYRYDTLMSTFHDCPDCRFIYWASESLLNAFKNGKQLDAVCQPRQGMATTNNDLFLRLWHEVSLAKIGFGCTDEDNALDSKKKWFPYNKGGGFRKWYGNFEYVVNFENKGKTICDYIDNTPGARVGSNGRVINRQFFFKKSITWSDICGNSFAARACPNGFIFDVKGSSAFVTERLYLPILSFLNSNVCVAFLNSLNPTITTQVGDMKQLPFFDVLASNNAITSIANDLICSSKSDWDSFETSWDFKRHPLVAVIPEGGSFFEVGNIDLAECYMLWEAKCNERFNKLKTNEEELNRIFIDIYGLQDELTPEVDEKDVTVRKADLGRDIRSLISYAVGCMFGRYSLDCEGLAYAGREWDASKYATFPADKDNIIPICDDDYFDDDITGRFIKWIETVYGAASLESNLKFIADALGGKGTPRDVIRTYFLNDFYADHLKTYQKRPIYWLFDSGKKNGFKALIYMHRYQPDTIARMRTDYVHEQQSRYRTAIADLEQRVNSASTGERVKLNKQLQKLQDQANEIRTYEEKIHHLADMMIPIDLDDGVKVNYAKFGDVLAKLK